MRLRHLPALLLPFVAGCVPATPRPTAPPPRTSIPQPAPSPVAPRIANDWRDWPLTPGTWVYARDVRGSIARFGEAGSDAVVTLRCDLGEHRIYLSRAGAIATPLTIRTTTATRALPVQPTGGTLSYVATALAANDPLLDAIGFSRGRFIVEQAGGPPLVIPAWAEIERVTEDCRE